MDYRNSEIKIDQIISYFNEEKINLIPPFQRGHVWPLRTRQKLIKNMVQGRPIPAIFLYKEASGSRYSYNILDGKQRLESLILFVGDQRADISITNVGKYFFGDKVKKAANFQVEIDGKKKGFRDLDEKIVRDFREYAIPTIEISLSEDSSLDEIISLFVDINQQGVAVNRFDIVKAMGDKDKLLGSVFGLLAERQQRGQDVFYRSKRNEFTNVLKRLQVVDSLSDGNSKVDRMWQLLLEIALFARNAKHRKPVEVLKSFIGGESNRNKLTADEQRTLRNVFKFIGEAYKAQGLGESRLATDQTQLYTLATSLMGSDLLRAWPRTELVSKIVAFVELLDGRKIPRQTPNGKRLATNVKRYQEFSAKQTTDPSRREERQRLFIEAVRLLPAPTDVQSAPA
jgi:hypothetical protein